MHRARSDIVQAWQHLRDIPIFLAQEEVVLQLLCRCAYDACHMSVMLQDAPGAPVSHVPLLPSSCRMQLSFSMLMPSCYTPSCVIAAAATVSAEMVRLYV